MSQLPVELWDIIFAHCSNSKIWDLCLVSKQMRAMAVQYLYRVILPTNAKRTIQLFWTLVQIPLVATYIRTLHVRAPFCLAKDVFKIPGEIEIGHDVNQVSWKDKMEYWTKRAAQSASFRLSQQARDGTSPVSGNEEHFFDAGMVNSLPVTFVESAFRRMTALQTLVIHTPSHPHMWTFSCELPALRHITIHKHADSSLLVCWLAKQSALTSIEYSPSPQYIEGWFPNEGPEVEPHFLPNLREISMDLVGVLLFVPGRPVDSLHVHIPKGGGLEDSNVNSEDGSVRRLTRKNLAQALRASTKPIKSLTLSALNTRDLKPFILYGKESLGSLTYLNLKLDLDAELGILLEETLGLFPNLGILEVPNDHQKFAARKALEHPPIESGPEAQLNKVTKWSTLARRLHTVILHPESPTMTSLARHSAKHGTCRYEVSIIRWAILRHGAKIEVTVME